RSLPQKTMLRWAVDQPLAWKKANEYGFMVERSTISRNGQAVVPIEKVMLTSEPIKPAPLEKWEALATQDQNVAVLAQSLFGDSFETTAPTSDILGRATAVNDELEQRFTLGLLAAEQRFDGALLAGWGLEDKTIVTGERYTYTISVALPEEATLAVRNGSVYAGPDLYEELPTPIGLAAVFGDGSVLLSWNFDLLSANYTSYFVERASNDSDFSPLNGTPIFNATQKKEGESVSLFYTDSIPNGTNYSYRIKGKTAFGEIGPPTQPITGKAVKALGVVPRIYKKEIPTDDSAILYWEFKEEGNALISKFQLRRSDRNDGPFELVTDNIPVSQRKTMVKGLKRINYFTLVAVGKNGINSESYPTMVQPVDSIPPSPPMALKGVADTTGIITLNWAKNLEEDLKGYRVFRSTNPEMEFSEVTSETYEREVFNDTVTAGNLNKKLYYRILAEDQRYNRSPFSEVLVVEKPDMIPPSPPVLKKYEVTEEGVRISWIPSSSSNVVSHVLYRKNRRVDALWERLFETTNLTDTLFLDSSLKEASIFDYTMVAKDSVGLESSPLNPITIVWKGKKVEEEDLKLVAIPNRELRFIALSWKNKNTETKEYHLYRGTSPDNIKRYKTFDGDIKRFNDTNLEINTTYTYGLKVIFNGGRTSGIKKISLKY
ncbi:MAG: hypothetical protein AAGF77_07835, partial [Bacteroidota bacterium]